jgi:hypothetical protein
MTPLIQLNRLLHYLFIAALLACFAIAQSAQALTPEPAQEISPNKWVIPINITHHPLVCAGGDVTLTGKLVVTFKVISEHQNRGKVFPDELKLEDFFGSAEGGRPLEAKDLRFVGKFGESTTRPGTFGFSVEFNVTGPGLPVGSPLRFYVRYSPIDYKFKDGTVTHVIPDGLNVKCK